jgi:ferrous iron transport protein A
MGSQTDLGNLETGKKAFVISICGGRGAAGRLGAMGIRPGVVLKKITGQPFGGPIVVQAAHSRVALGYGMAKKVLVEIDDREDVS